MAIVPALSSPPLVLLVIIKERQEMREASPAIKILYLAMLHIAWLGHGARLPLWRGNEREGQPRGTHAQTPSPTSRGGVSSAERGKRRRQVRGRARGRREVCVRERGKRGLPGECRE